MLCYTSKKGVMRSTENFAFGKREANRKLAPFAKAVSTRVLPPQPYRAERALPGGCREADLPGTHLLGAGVGGPMHSPVT